MRNEVFLENLILTWSNDVTQYAYITSLLLSNLCSVSFEDHSPVSLSYVTFMGAIGDEKYVVVLTWYEHSLLRKGLAINGMRKAPKP